jgi:aryl-alcohol dehydrogenase-like predicted oxidoreductase
MAANPVDAEELLWRELCALAAAGGGGGGGGGGAAPSVGRGLAARLAQPDPRPIFNSILDYFDGRLERASLLKRLPQASPLDCFYICMYVALHLQALGIDEALSRTLLVEAQRQNCCDNLGLACGHMRIAPFVRLGGSYSCPRLIVGCAGLASSDTSVARLQAAARHGLCAVDVADIYPGAEELVRTAGCRLIQTKFVPDHSSLDALDAGVVEDALWRSLARLGRRPHAVYLHWWGTAQDKTLPVVAAALESARAKQMFGCIGVTNMDAPHLEAVCAACNVGCAQVALSLLDRRAIDGGLCELCGARGISVVGYGALAGGLLHERWLGMPEPLAAAVAPPQRKYLARIQVQGGWGEFQSLLRDVAAVARRHSTCFAAVALSWALCHADAMIVACPRSDEQLAASLGALELTLSAADLECLSRPSPQDLGMPTAPGVYVDERDPAHPVGAMLSPWRDTAHLGPAPTEEASRRASSDPHAPFLSQHMARLGMEAAHAQAVREAGDRGRQGSARLDHVGVARGVWAKVSAELCGARGGGELRALAASRVGALDKALA